MAERDSFVLYTEQKDVVDKLSDEEAGKLIKAIYEYAYTGNLPTFNNYLDIILIPFKQNLDRNAEKWESIREKRRQAGKAGAEIKKQNLAKQANANFAEHNLANEAVNVNVNVNDNVNIKENIKRKDFIPPSIDEIEKYIREKNLIVEPKKFFDYFNEGNWTDSKGNKVKNWKQKLLTWNGYKTAGVMQKELEFMSTKEDLSGLYDN